MTVIIDIRTPSDCRAALVQRGFEIIALPPFPCLAEPVASHPDMLIFFTDKHLITHKSYFPLAQEQLNLIAQRSGRRLLLTDESIGNIYPSDVLLNAAVVGNTIIGSERTMSTHIKEYGIACQKQIINVKQGYAKCSVCIVDDNAIITADLGIADKAKKAGIDVLTVTPGHVTLEGYDTGFIGGASGLCRDTVYFCGNSDRHPDADSIRAFCQKHGKQVASLSDGKLLDVGTLFFL